MSVRRIDFLKVSTQQLSTRELDMGPGAVYSIAFSNDEQQLATFGDRIIWDCTTGLQTARLPDCRTGMVMPVSSPDDSILASVSDEAVVALNLRTSVIQFFPVRDCQGDYVRQLVFGKRSPTLIYRNDWTVHLWNLAVSRELVRIAIPSGEEIIHVSESASGTWTVYWLKDSLIYASDCITGKLLFDIPVPGRPCRFAFSSDGRLVDLSAYRMVNGRKVGQHESWDLVSVRRLSQFIDPDVLRMTDRLCDDGRLIIGGDGFRVWNVHTGERTVEVVYSPKLHAVKTVSVTGIVAATSRPFDLTRNRTLFFNSHNGSVIGAAHDHTNECPQFSGNGRWFASVLDSNFIVSLSDNAMKSQVRLGTLFLTDLSPLIAPAPSADRDWGSSSTRS